MISMIKSILQGRFMNHPLHPMLVHFPIGLWVASFLFDIGFFFTANSALARSSYYCMVGGLIGAAFAALAGLADSIDIPKNSVPRKIATSHMVINLAVTLIFGLNAFLRYGMSDSVPTFVSRGQFVLSLFGVILLSMAGFLGGLLVYNYGIGFKPQLRGKPRDEIKRAA